MIALFVVFTVLGAIGSAVSPVKQKPTADSATTTPAPSSTALPTPSESPSPSPSDEPLFVQPGNGATLPNRALTPGSTFADATTPRICVPGYSSSVRDVSETTRKAVFAAYHVDYATRSGYELDHLIPLELGGDNSATNLWPEPLTGAGAADVKDHLENHLHDLVCSGQVPLGEAQQAMRGDWWAANGKYSPIAVVKSAPSPSSTATVVPQIPSPRTAAPAPVRTPAYSPPTTHQPASSSGSSDTYTNVDGNQVPRPTRAPSVPSGATAKCNDGTYSFSQHHQGTCSHHGGVAQWL